MTQHVETNQKKSSCFDEHIYHELRSFIYGDDSLRGRNHAAGVPPSFDEVIEKINGFSLRKDLRIRVIKDTLEFFLGEHEKDKKSPFFVVSYLCRETVKNMVLRKFNELLGCKCPDIQGLSHAIGDNVRAAGKVFSSLRVCDFSTGPGYFLSFVLDEMIAVKSQLGIFVDTNANPLYNYRIVSGEGGLNVFDKKKFKQIILDGSTQEKHRLQEALYHEKIELIQNCIFGTDESPFNVLFCKLRLWLNAVLTYGREDKALPRIESNIFCGDALVSRFSLDEDLPAALKNINQTVKDYKRLSKEIKTTTSLSERCALRELQTLVRTRLIDSFGWYSKDTEELLHLRRKLSEMMMPGLFQLTEQEIQARNEQISLLHTQIKKQEEQLYAFRHNPAFKNAVEWRYDFPELLNEEGVFMGFDAVVGVLPDATIAAIGAKKAHLYRKMGYRVYKKTANVSDLFCELANRLLVYGGSMFFIMPSQWQRDNISSKTGKYLSTEMDPLKLITFDDIAPQFHMLKNKCAIIVKKDINRHCAVTCCLKASYSPDTIALGDYITEFGTPAFRLSENEPTAESPVMMSDNVEYADICNKIRSSGLLIKQWKVEAYSGMMTGLDEAFILDETTKKHLIGKDYKNSDIIKPLLTRDLISRYNCGEPSKWLLYIPWHFPLHYDVTINAASERAEQRFVQQYPDAYKHLLGYKEALSFRNAIEIGLGFEWYAIQRLNTRNDRVTFDNQKIVWGKGGGKYSFALDYGGCAVLDDTCFMVGQHLKFLLGILNSTMGQYMLADLSKWQTNESPSGLAIIKALSIPVPNGKTEAEVVTLVNHRISETLKDEAEKNHIEESIDRLAYELYGLTEAEISFVKAQKDSF